MKYAVEYRNFHTGIHGLMLFEEQKEAEKGLNRLRELEYKADKLDRDDYVQFMDNLFKTTYSIIEEVDFRQMEKFVKGVSYSVKNGSQVSTKTDDVTIINSGLIPDIY